jgi:uncharacterized membrane protein
MTWNINQINQRANTSQGNYKVMFGRGMLLALNFEVGSNILKTILVTSFIELAILAVIVSIRIVLKWSLSKEIVILNSLTCCSVLSFSTVA